MSGVLQASIGNRRTGQVMQRARPEVIAPARLHNRTGLPDRLKAAVEALSGFSLDDVRVHDGSTRPAQVHALAYAQGRDIHLGRGQSQHLPHEAWHVVQQLQGRVAKTATVQGVPINDDARLEREADLMGHRSARIAASLETFGQPASGFQAAAFVGDHHRQALQRVRYVRTLGGDKEVPDDYRLGPEEDDIPLRQDPGDMPMWKTQVELVWDLDEPASDQIALYKGTSLGSMLVSGGIAQSGLNPRKGGMGGGSGVWEGNAPDRSSNLGWTTFGTSADVAKTYALGFERDRRKTDDEARMMHTTGKLNAKWIGVILRVLVSRRDLQGADWRDDPGSGAGGAYQTNQTVEPGKVEIAGIVAFLSPTTAKQLSSHQPVDAINIVNIISSDFFSPHDWNPAPQRQ